LSRRSRDIRRPSDRKRSSGFYIYFIFTLFVGLAIYLLLSRPGLLHLIDENSNEELQLHLKSENKELRTEIDLLRLRIRTFESTADDFKIKIEDLKREIRFLKSDIEGKQQELSGLTNSPIKITRKTNSQQNRDTNRSSREEESVNNEVDLSRAHRLVRPKGGPVVIYPRKALSRDLTGKVTIRFDISEEGIPLNIRVVSSTSPIFDKAAIDAVKKFVYLPARDKRGNEIVVKDIDYPFRFELD